MLPSHLKYVRRVHIVANPQRVQVKAIWASNSSAAADEVRCMFGPVCVIRRVRRDLFSKRVIGWQNMAWVEGLKGIVQPLSSGSYVNYIDPFMQGGCDV